jgi:hypothetical protein
MALDFQGNVVSIIQILALVLLTVGVYPYRIRTKNRNLIMHGFLSIIALSLNLITVFWVMIPTFRGSGSLLGNLSILQSTIVWLHVATGLASILLGSVMTFSWITHPLGELGCSRTWRLMLPTFVVWAIALALGLAIHIFEIV